MKCPLVQLTAGHFCYAVAPDISAGEIISRGRTAKDIVRLSEAIVGWTSGGLGTATIFGCFFFAGTSGSSSADTITIGRIMMNAMRSRGYNASYAASLAASGGILGVIIPPSLIFIIYGIATSTSIGDLFLGGIVPGLLIALTLSIANSLVCRFSSWALVDKKPFSFRFNAISLVVCQMGPRSAGNHTRWNLRWHFHPN